MHEGLFVPLKSFCREEQTCNFALKNFGNYTVHDEQFILIKFCEYVTFNSVILRMFP